MFCVIQEIETKKTNKNGYAKELYAREMNSSLLGNYYYWSYGSERFERPIKKAYRISLHQSYREGGKVKKKQFVLCTMNYYDLATDFFTVYDWCGMKISTVSEFLEVCEDDIYEIVQEKTEMLKRQIQEEFALTEEYKTHKKHEEIIAEYNRSKKEFAGKYEVDEKEYDKCYDVFGVLRNQKYFSKIDNDYRWKNTEWHKEAEKFRQEYRQQEQAWEESFKSQSKESSYYEWISNNYSRNEKEILKQFYRTLSKKYHPDSNPDKDTSEEMRLLNELKSKWGV